MFWLIFIIGQVIFWVGSYMDYQSSLKQTAYGVDEGNKFNRDKYGYFSPSVFWRNHAIFWAVFTAIALVMFAYDTSIILAIFGAMFILAGGVSIYTAFRNNAKAENSRRNIQTPLLLVLSNIKPYDYDAAESVFAPQGFWKRRVGGRIRAVMFPNLYMDGGTDEQFEESFYKAIWETSQKPQSQWFTDTRMRRLN